MPDPNRRSRAISLASESADSLRTLLESLDVTLDSDASSDHPLPRQSQCLRELHHVLLDSPHRKHVLDDYRRLQGFEKTVLLLELSFETIVPFDDDAQDLFTGVLDVLGEALADHSGNARYFTSKLEPSGWARLRNCFLKLFDANKTSSSYPQKCAKLFGLLFALATRESSLSTAFLRAFVESTSEDESSSNEVLLSTSRQHAQDVLNGNEIVHIPQALEIAVDLWLHFFGPTASSTINLSHSALLVPLLVRELFNGSEANAMAIAALPIGNNVVDTYLLWKEQSVQKMVLRDLCLDVLRLGCVSRKTQLSLMENAKSSSTSLDLLLEATVKSRDPTHIRFDMSLQGFASLEYTHMRGYFPPHDSNACYAITAWVRFDAFDDATHTSLFGAFDESQTSFLLLYVEKDTRQLVLQTSTSSESPSVRFKSTTFDTSRWYHIAIVHKKAKSDSPSRAAFFLDGRLREQVKCHYPSQPPLIQSANPSSILTTQKHYASVQAFFGTPRDLSPRHGRAVLSSRWSLASAHVFSGPLPDELIMVMKRLGPAYHGNFQDCLGSFQTYRASANLNLYNESLHPQDSENSMIAKSLRSNASRIFVEDRLALAVSAEAVFQPDAGYAQRRLLHDLSSIALKTFQLTSSNGSAAIALNTAKASIPDTVTRNYGVGLLAGGSYLYNPRRLDNVVWQMTGCVSLSSDILESCSTSSSLLTATKLMFELIVDNWRNSESSEREEGYGIVSSVLNKKFLSSPELFLAPYSSTGQAKGSQRSTAFELLQIVLEYLGFERFSPQRSLIVNPLAYRVLIVDCDIWRRCDESTQQLFYDQLFIFTSKSRFADFNKKRLGRMRVLKRLVDSWRSHRVYRKVLPSLNSAFKDIVAFTMSHDTLRSISLYVTSSLLPSADEQQDGDEVFIHGNELAIQILQTFESMLCDPITDHYVRRFTKTVTNKWLLFLLYENSPKVISSAATILARVLITAGESYISKFDTKTNGFVILKAQYSKWADLEAPWVTSLCILFGIDGAKEGVQHIQDIKSLVLAPGQRDRLFCPAIMPVIAVMIEKSSNAPDSPSGHLALEAVKCLRDLYDHYTFFHSWVLDSELVQLLLRPLFAASSNEKIVTSPNTERKSTFERNGSHPNLSRIPSSDSPSALQRTVSGLDRQPGSSYIVVDPNATLRLSLEKPLAPRDIVASREYETGELWNKLLKFTAVVCTDSVLHRKDFTGLGLYLKTPPASDAERSRIVSIVMQESLNIFIAEIRSDLNKLIDPKFLSNIARFISQLVEALYEGWLLQEGVHLLRFVRTLIERLEMPDTRKNKTVRLCSPMIDSMRHSLRRILLFVSLDAATGFRSTSEQILAVAGEAVDCMPICMSEDDDEELRVPETLFALFRMLTVANTQDSSFACISALRSLIAQQPSIVHSQISTANAFGSDELGDGLISSIQSDDSHAFTWISERRSELEEAFSQTAQAATRRYVEEENKQAHKSAKVRKARRIERLESWHLQDLANLHTITEYEAAAKLWSDNIKAAETWKFHRSRQDHQENIDYLSSESIQQIANIRRIEALYLDEPAKRWQLNSIEGRDRMRMRVSPAPEIDEASYIPKRERARSLLNSNMAVGKASPISAPSTSSPDIGTPDGASTPTIGTGPSAIDSKSTGNDEDFEVVATPSHQEEEMEDKNRKVMRSLQRGERVLSVYNVTVIRGLEPCESLLIIGVKGLYLMENLFQRGDGEVVNAWEAPKEERDPYMQVISGRKVDQQLLGPRRLSGKASFWTFIEVISISQRHFLFRDVALEIFFADGQSFLLTTAKHHQREDLCTELLNQMRKIKDDNKQRYADASWRIDLLQNPRDITTSFGSKVASVFGSHIAYPFTRKWLRGELSNFQYLMIINTMAGRTFNDLTQYPVFPWVLSDYTSEELDLTNPRSFRDLSKPMGCQTQERETAFRERYNTFAEMSDGTTPPFHYGTHYSSAMIVTSYLIRLQPFVQAFLLLQGGNFDHPERMFYSVEKTWSSASKDTFSDVRELTPEFFYLPDFLMNVNKYNFGTKSNGEVVDSVILPPWAKGDPDIFIAKHREALESEYVSKNLHSWIDLVFGQKQRGDAALESVNVFHHLSYHGAKNLDTITDDLERMATIGIIHNFGQTPRQVFTKPHERREVVAARGSKLIKAFTTLSHTPSVLIKTTEQIGGILYSPKSQRIFSATPFEAFQPPMHDVVAKWGFSDRSIRFFATSSMKPLGVFEHPHCGQIITATFVDSSIFVTGSEDSTICVWNVTTSIDAVDMSLKGVLRGHEEDVCALSAAPSLGTLVSASVNGQVILWDFRKLEMIRWIKVAEEVQTLAINDWTGHIFIGCDSTTLLYTLNGQLLIKQNMSETGDNSIVCGTFYVPNNSAWYGAELIFTGHRHGVAKVWNVVVAADGKWQLDLVQKVDHVDRSRDDGKTLEAAVTAILPTESKLYVGDSDGRVYEWTALR